MVADFSPPDADIRSLVRSLLAETESAARVRKAGDPDEQLALEATSAGAVAAVMYKRLTVLSPRRDVRAGVIAAVADAAPSDRPGRPFAGATPSAEVRRGG